MIEKIETQGNAVMIETMKINEIIDVINQHQECIIILDETLKMHQDVFKGIAENIEGLKKIVSLLGKMK